MATLRDLLDDLNDRLNDADDAAGAGLVNKTRYINHGVRAMYPKVYQSVSDSSLVIVEDTYEYSLPASFDDAKIVRVDLETDEASGMYQSLYNYEILPVLDDKLLLLQDPDLLVHPGAKIRIVGVQALSALAGEADVYTGPPGTEELPVWYALGLALSRRVEDRTLYTRFSTTVAQNGVGLESLMGAASFAFAQFELLLDRHEMPLPAQAS